MDAIRDRVRETMQSFFLSDVEMGKKDDDHSRQKAGSNSSLHMPLWAPVRVQPRKFLKRISVVLLIGIAIYLFVHNLPTDVPIRDHRIPVYRTPEQGQPDEAPRLSQPGVQNRKQHIQQQHKQQSPSFSQRLGKAQAAEEEEPGVVTAAKKGTKDGQAPATYNGLLRFLNLASTLRAITNTRGGYLVNKNVLFAAASLKSVSTLLPMACQMGSELRSYVHFAIMSKSDISLVDLQQINGIDGSCNIFFHDARPDYAWISTDARMENSVNVAMSHIQLYMHPQAVIIDGSSVEEAYLKNGIRTYTKDSQTPVIELPENGARRLAWLAKLDSASLSNWKKISVDILIHAYPGASGSLIRLLKSLSSADYGGGPVPHVTIELPPKIDPPTERFLETFQWPPERFASQSGARQLSLRHRIPKHGLDEEESSIRFLESFWPTHPQNSHVLVLSPQVELSPEFFHYVKYTLLEYRYSNPALLQEWDKRLFAVSLDLPPSGLDGTTRFSPPPMLEKKPIKGEVSTGTAGESTSFLWQAPNSNAVLFLGERWMELHRFVTQLLEAQHATTAAQQQQQQFFAQKRVSKRFPSWLEHALRLCRARGFWTLYPSAATASSLATVHNELYKPPEEYEKDVLTGEDGGSGAKQLDGKDDEIRLGSKSLLETLPHGGGLAPFSDLPLLTWDGKEVSLDAINDQAIEYATSFRRIVGGCSEGMLDVLLPETLFCNEDE